MKLFKIVQLFQDDTKSLTEDNRPKNLGSSFRFLDPVTILLF